MTRLTGPWWERPTSFAVGLATLVALFVWSAEVRDRVYAASRVETRLLYIPDGEVLDRMALSFDALLADVYWIRALQHYGGTKRSEDEEKSYELLGPLLDIATTLDPRFNAAYRFGSIFLTEGYPNGPGRPDLAIALLQKGIEEMPDKWQYYMDIGFIPLLVAAGLRHRGELVRESGGCAGRLPVAAVARGQHAGHGRESRVVPHVVAADI